jgi:sec-independent protein translocase protein TatC
MLRVRQDDDLFKDSTMTFGEHLAQLRKCLFKALFGLLAGVFVGLYFGDHVVRFIQTPLTDALEKYYEDGVLSKLENEIEQSEKSGEPMPWKYDEVERVVKTHRMLPDEYFIDAAELASQLKGTYPEQFQGLSFTTPKAEDGTVEPVYLRLFLWHHLSDDKRVRATALSAHEVFMIWLKASIVVGAVLSSPWVFYQLWTFVAAGLYRHEKRYVNIYLPFSVGLFLIGVMVAFYGAFPLILRFLFSFNRALRIDIDPRISEWIGFVLFLPLGFGIAFQLPLVMLFLNRVGLFSVEAYVSYWRVAVLVIFIVAAILTPPDPYSMTLLALPLTLLYFAGILLCKWMPRGKSLFGLPDD